MGGSIFGLHAFHISNLTFYDQLRELGASKELLQSVVRIDALRVGKADGRREAMEDEVRTARQWVERYYSELERNSQHGNRADDGRDEFSLAFLIDDDLAAILNSFDSNSVVAPIIPRTSIYLKRHPDKDLANAPGKDPDAMLEARLNRLNRSAVDLTKGLYGDFLAVLELSKHQYHSSRLIVWSAALAVMAMLCGLAALFHRWVLYPVRLLQRGVRRVARGQFDYRIELSTGDEMQALAEAFNDMTTRLSATYADLERQVQERSRQLVRSERLAGVGFLAAGVAHEINNPLASIAFCSEALENRLRPMLDSLPSADSRLAGKYLRMIQEEAFRCKRITEKLLDFSRCNDIQRQRTDLAELVLSVVEMIRHMGKYRGKNIIFNPKEAVVAHVDGQEIKQVVLNLVVNALDCMETGGTLRIDLRHVEGMAEMVFTDDGCGMAPDVLENIFEPFFTRRRVGKGTGLGLSITHRIINQHQGEITATSRGEGLGATFRVRLPSRPVEEAPERVPNANGHRAA
jgi:signal transduction histidine kinase